LTLYIHYNVREDAILLFGFPTRDEQFLFRKLLDVTGIGPRVALGILAGGSPQAVVVAIQEEDLLFLTKLPGIGRKTAQRIVLDLKDKLAALHMADHGTQKGTIQNKRPNAKHAAWQDVAEALMSLGYHEAETDKAWQSIKDTATDQESVDSLMKKALKALYQG
jgi:Holliday junction DNA helicase RuvA